MGVIDLRIPGTYIVTFVIFLLLFGGHGFDMELHRSRALRWWSDAWCIFHGNRLCDITDHTEGTDHLSVSRLGILTGLIPCLWCKRRRCILLQSSYATCLVPMIERIYNTKSIWSGKGGERRMNKKIVHDALDFNGFHMWFSV